MDRFELARLSYSEVLDATKHQDDKIGRVLGALAFFVAGAIAFLDPSTMSTTYDFGDGRAIPLAAISLGVFLTLAFMSALLFVLSTTTPLAFRSSRGDRNGVASDVGRSRPGEVRSYLYFTQIGKLSEHEWTDAWRRRTDTELTGLITENLIRETHNIAVRVDRKYSRSREASALLLAAIPFLVTTLLLSLDSLVDTKPVSTTMEWSPELRFCVGLALSAFAGVRLFYEGTRSAEPLGRLLVVFPLAIVLIVWADSGSIAWTIIVTIVAVGAAWLFIDQHSTEKPSDRVAAWGVGAVAVGAVVVTIADEPLFFEPSLWRLVFGVLLTSALPVAELLNGIADVMRRTERD